MMSGKCCTKCARYKLLADFHKHPEGKLGRHPKCKECRRKDTEHYRNKNAERITQKRHQKFTANPEAHRKYHKQYYKDNANRIRQRVQQWRKDNPEYKKRYIRNRQKIDPLFKLTNKLRILLIMSLKKQGYTKRSRTHQLLGADYETVFNHLQETARVNYGYWLADLDYHIDHIIPCSTAKTEEELIALQHYSNLQLLRPCDNMTKGNKLDYITPYMRSKQDAKKNFINRSNSRNKSDS